MKDIFCLSPHPWIQIQNLKSRLILIAYIKEKSNVNRVLMHLFGPKC